MNRINVLNLALTILLVGVHTNSHALNVKAAYEKELQLQKEVADEVEDLSKSVWEIKFERDLIESLVFTQSGALLRSDLIKSRDADMKASDGLVNLVLHSSLDPQSRAYFQEIIDQHEGLNVHFSHEVSIENARDKTVLKTKKTTRSVDGLIKNSGMSQRYDGLLPGAKECLDDVYSFRGGDYRDLIGCGVYKAIDQGRYVKTGKSKDFTIDMKLSGQDQQPALTLSCDLYELGPNVARSSPGVAYFDKRLCIANHNGTPIVYSRDTVLQLEGKTPTKTSIKLRFLEFDSIADHTTFDIEKAKVCSDPLVKDQRKTRC